VQASFTYDAHGNLATETGADGYTQTHQYDIFDRRIKTAYADGSTTEYTWDKLDLLRIKDRNGNVKHYRYDSLRRLTGVTDALRAIEYGYDENGRLVSLTDGNGHTTRWERDLQGRAIAKVMPDGARTVYEYDSAGRQIRRIDALGQERLLTWSQDNRLTGATYHKAVTPTAAIRLKWNAWYPRLDEMRDGTGVTKYGYEKAGVAGALKLASEDGPAQNELIALGYDALGRVQSLGVDAEREIALYDELGRIRAAQSSALGEFQYSYLGDTGQIVEAALGGAPIRRSYSYESRTNGRALSGLAHAGEARSYRYANAAQNLITGITETVKGQSRAWRYEYDVLSRLQGAERSDGKAYRYELDAADNLRTILRPEGKLSFAHDAANKIVHPSRKYDANGNLTADETRTFRWDAENRLVGIGYKISPHKRTEFRYDGKGRRVAIIETDGVSRRETRYTWCGNNICQARDGNDRPIAYYSREGVYRPGLDGAPGRWEYYARDHQGSVRDVLDSAGKLVARYDYDPYGKLIGVPESAPEFGYAGMQYHAASGLYLTRFRVYDPQSARWLSRDPIGEAGGLNLYGYVGGNPVTLVDPLGLCGELGGETPAKPGILDGIADGIYSLAGGVYEFVYGGLRGGYGVIEAGTTIVTGTFAFVIGGVVYMGTGYYDWIDGDFAIAPLHQPRANQLFTDITTGLTYVPRTPEGQYLVGLVGSLGEAMVPLTPLLPEITIATRLRPVGAAANIARAPRVVNTARVVNNADVGITWGRGIQGQGMPWENYLASRLAPDARLPAYFKTFDFFDLDTGLATSAKTLDTRTVALLNNPETIYSTLKGYVDDVADFTEYSLSGIEVDASVIRTREIQLAIPAETTPAQWVQINHAIEYAELRNVQLIVTLVR
jgi:RHS repeat-associated protein